MQKTATFFNFNRKSMTYDRAAPVDQTPPARIEARQPAPRARFSDRVYYQINLINSLKTPALQPSHSKGFRGAKKIS